MGMPIRHLHSITGMRKTHILPGVIAAYMAAAPLAPATGDEAPAGHGDEPFIFFVLGDSEVGMRGNTYPQLETWVDKVNAIEDLDLVFTSGDFAANESPSITKPSIVFLAGDINGDRSFEPGEAHRTIRAETDRLFDRLDDDILFLPGHGNHDWDPDLWSDEGYGHTIAGLRSNLGTADFVRSRYLKAIARSEDISDASSSCDRNGGWFPPTTSAAFNYSLVYKGVRFTQLNQFLYQPAARVTFGSMRGRGPARYYRTKTEDWFRGLCTESAKTGIPHAVVQHYPVRTNDGWWNDYMGGTPDALRRSFLELFARSHRPAMFTGHNHAFSKTAVPPYGIIDYTAGYFANGFLIAAKASAAKGVYAVTFVDLGKGTTIDPSSFAATLDLSR